MLKALIALDRVLLEGPDVGEAAGEMQLHGGWIEQSNRGHEEM